MAEQDEAIVAIPEFLGINQGKDKYVLGINGYAYDMQNCRIEGGALKRSGGGSLYFDTGNIVKSSLPSMYLSGYMIKSLMISYWLDDTYIWFSVSPNGEFSETPNAYLFRIDQDKSAVIMKEVDSVLGYQVPCKFHSPNFDYVNYQAVFDTENADYDDEAIILATDFTGKFTVGDIIKYTPPDNVRYSLGNTRPLMKLKKDGVSSADSDSNIAPAGKFPLIHKERLWLFSDTAAFFSKDFDPQDFTAPTSPASEVNNHGGEIQLPTWDGGKVIGAAPINEDILVFKDYSVHKIYGTYPGNYNLTQVYTVPDGSIIDKTVVTIEGNAFWTTTKGIVVYNGVATKDISDRVKDIFKNVNKTYINNAVASVYDGKYIVALPEGSSADNNLVIEYDYKRDIVMVRRDITTSSFLRVGNDLYYANITKVNGRRVNTICKYETNTAMPYSYWQSGYSSFGDATIIKHVVLDELMCCGSGSLKISLISDKRTKTKTITLPSTLKPVKVKLSNSGKFMSLKFENVNGSDFTIVSTQLAVEGE